MSASEYIVITVPSLQGKLPADQRIGRTLFHDGASDPVYKHSVYGETALKYLDSIGVGYTTQDTDANGVPA